MDVKRSSKVETPKRCPGQPNLFKSVLGYDPLARCPRPVVQPAPPRNLADEIEPEIKPKD